MTHSEKELAVVKATKTPKTISSLIKDFRKIGLKSGDIVIVHSSMSKIGWISGGEVAVVEALMQVITPEGTIVMPSMTTGNTNPEGWQNPPVPESWWPIIAKERPPYHPDITPTRGMGRIAELFRKYPGVSRSNHPIGSFAAWGKEAKYLTKEHQTEEMFGNGSPLEKLYELNGKILLLGVSHSNNTSLHYAEWKAKIPNQPKNLNASAVLEKGKRIWKTWEEIDYDDEDFEQIGLEFEKAINYKPARVGDATSRLISMRLLVDFAVDWMKSNRKYSQG